jgi:hypothetical protein
MKTLKSILKEGSSLERETIKGADNNLVNELRDRYYGVSDHITKMVAYLNRLNGDTGMFGGDLKNAKAALKAFDKISLGKYL